MNFGPEGGRLEFHQCEFLGEASMEIKRSDDSIGVGFHYCNLEGLRFSTLPYKEVQIEFDEIKKWNSEKKWWHASRKKILDESQETTSGVKLVQLYSFLENYFYDNQDYSLASDFYIGQMVSMRRDVNYGRTSKVANWFYQVISSYGEAITRPLLAIAIALVLLFVPIITLFSGTTVTRLEDGSQNADAHTVNYDLFSPGPNEYLWNDYQSAFLANLALSTIDRKSELAPPPDSYQKAFLVGGNLTSIDACLFSNCGHQAEIHS